jgi:hypothetical protein
LRLLKAHIAILFRLHSVPPNDTLGLNHLFPSVAQREKLSFSFFSTAIEKYQLEKFLTFMNSRTLVFSKSYPFLKTSMPSSSMKTIKSPTFNLKRFLASEGTVTWPFVLSLHAPNVLAVNELHLLIGNEGKFLYVLPLHYLLVR